MVKEELLELINAGVHFGHRAHRWNPKMLPYIYALKKGVHIIDLVKTIALLRQACDFVERSSQEGKTFLFIGTKKQASAIVAAEAEQCGVFYVNHRWLGGMLTNWITIRQRIKKLSELEKFESDGTLEKLPKKEGSKMQRELNRLRRNFGGIKTMKQIPDIVYIVDQRHEITAVKEAVKVNIPIISILDTNCNPELVTFGIPGNDDSIGSIQYITRKLATSIQRGKTK